MPTREELEDGLQVLLDETDFSTGLESLDKSELIELILRMNHAAKMRERWLTALLRALGPEVAGMLPVNEAISVHSITKAVKTLRAQRDEARVQAKKLTGKELGNLNIVDRLADTASVILAELETYQREVSNHESVAKLMTGVRELLAYISGDLPDDSFQAQKKKPVRAKHIGSQDFKRMPDNPSDTIAREMPLHQAPMVADMENFLEQVTAAKAQEIRDAQEKQAAASMILKPSDDNKVAYATGSDFEFDDEGDLKMVGMSDGEVRERVRRAFNKPEESPYLPDYGTALTPGTFVQGIDHAVPGTDSTGHVVMSTDDFEALQTVANASSDSLSGADLSSMQSIVQAVRDIEAEPTDMAIALAAGDAGRDHNKNRFASLKLAGPKPDPMDASDAIPAGIVPMMANRPLTAGELVTVNDVTPIPQSGEVEMKVLKRREPRDGDPVIELSWDGAAEEDAVEPESEDDEQLF